MVERLHLFGIDHLADLHRLNLTQKQLEAQFKAEGKRLYQVAHGAFTQPVQRFKENRPLPISVGSLRSLYSSPMSSCPIFSC